MLIFDGWHLEQSQLKKLVEVCGAPKCLIALNMTRELVTKMHRKKKELDEAAELGEEDLETIERSIKAHQDYVEFFTELS